jgi:hypothetical protein
MAYPLINDVIDQLIDYLPLYMIEKCIMTPMFTINQKFCRVRRQHIFSPRAVLTQDAIAKNDVPYCVKVFADMWREMYCASTQHKSTNRMSDEFNGFWRTAIRLARIDILEKLVKKNHGYLIKYICPQVKAGESLNLDVYHGRLINSFIINWLICQCILISNWEDAETMFWHVVHAENITVLEMLYAARYLEVTADLEHRSMSHEGVMSSSYTRLRRRDDHVLGAIKSRAKVLAWTRGKEWPKEIEDILRS